MNPEVPPLVEEAMPASRWAPPARQSLALANVAARDAGAAEVTLEHLLLGILAEGSGVAVQALRSLGADLSAIAAEANPRLPGPVVGDAGPPGLSAQSSAVLRRAEAEADRLGYPSVGQAHLLLALLNAAGPVADVLGRHGASYEGVLSVLPSLWRPSNPQAGQRVPISTVAAYIPWLNDTAAEERARIEVERINGPVLLVSGRNDAMWPSTLMAKRAMARLAMQNRPFKDEHLAYDAAGHTVGSPSFLPSTMLASVHPVDGTVYAYGGTASGVARANADAWPKMLKFLRENLRTPEDVSGHHERRLRAH
jgi:pimeloyl-ACP methyl ester carboxylesterase